mgnify:CR=1 FL=1
MSAIGQHEFCVKWANESVVLSKHELFKARAVHARMTQFLPEQFLRKVETATNIESIVSWSNEDASYIDELLVDGFQLKILIPRNWAENFAGRYFEKLRLN